MFKVVYVARFRKDKTKEEVSAHWTDVHGPMGLKLPGFVGYTQNHMKGSIGPAGFVEAAGKDVGASGQRGARVPLGLPIGAIDEERREQRVALVEDVEELTAAVHHHGSPASRSNASIAHPNATCNHPRNGTHGR